MRDDSKATRKDSTVRTIIRILFVVIVAVIPGMAAAQDIAAGKIVFDRHCLPCHAVGPNAPNKVGPVLNGLNGRKTGTVNGYPYSEANKNSGIVWDEQSFLDYIKDPRKKIPGTKMFFTGLRNEQDARALWAYLRQFDAAGQPPAPR